MSSWANVAVLVKAKTLEGGLSTEAVEGLPFLLEVGMEVTFVPPVLNVPRTARVTQVDHKGGRRYLVRFDSIDSMTLAEKLEGHFCLVEKAALPEDYDAVPGEGLEGFSVVDASLGVVGTVSGVAPNPAHPLLVVQTEQGEAFIPLVDAFVVSVNEDEARIDVALPEGLLEVQ